MDESWSDPAHVLDVVTRLITAPRPELLPRFSRELAAVLPHRAAAMQTGDCTRSPFKVTGDTTITDAVTSVELEHLADLGVAGEAVVVEGVLAGVERTLVLLTSRPVVGNGAVLVVVPEGDVRPARDLGLAARLWDLSSTDAGQRAADPGPEVLATNLAASAARAQTVTDLGQTHAATLVALLSVLRSGRLGDRAARQTATDLAARALVDLRAVTKRDQTLSAESARAAFAVLSEQLAPIVGHADVAVDLVEPSEDRRLPQDIAHTARTVTRGLVIAALDRPGTTRVRASWRFDGPALRITVRDDSPDVPDVVVDPGLTERITPLNGHWEVDTVPGWGATITAVLPLTSAEPPELRPLDRLNPRELEVLAGISEGLRNRQIADRLQLSEHTVKFHVRNLLEKLKVTSRGQAAALAHDLRLEPVAVHRTA
ncbi:helix-turn-helix transcriptional regulator [Amycolatopsis sp. PS_44_ISF1]|uniref:helix-turn-helix transcriptional regulator n=1 Tax=Amycolatopsis sp. PS_44_ISF1 TaxID=2974917 RepID=UPI0028DEF32D|nr:helix-turn-helix transcriptional regulator [Amycolatopsis sp. PS_44_ISF1]MDT8915692.1 helix-turn-helix transcriptional regulator [Amycolatopsis sp. PS_44_ISF1]